MARFINIAIDDTKPVLINIDDIAAVHEDHTEQRAGQPQTSIRITGTDGREKAFVNAAAYNIDVDDAVAKLAAAGVDLVSLPATWDTQQTGRYFVNPAAFQYIITSKPSVDKGQTEESSAVLLSVRGAYIESRSVPLSVIDELLAKVGKALPLLRTVDTNRMTARFYDMGQIAYNPAAVVGIEPSGDRVDVRFAGALIDFHAPRRDWCNFYLDRKFNNATPEKRAAFRRAVWDNPAVDTHVHIVGFEDKIRNRLGREFARAVAADVPELIRIDGVYGPRYHRFNDVGMMSLYEDKQNGHTVLSVQPTQSNGGSMRDSIRVSFKTRDKAEKEMGRLAGILAAPKP